jgi:hypothetical protein
MQPPAALKDVSLQGGLGAWSGPESLVMAILQELRQQLQEKVLYKRMKEQNEGCRIEGREERRLKPSTDKLALSFSR